MIAHRAHLFRANRRFVPRIEKQDDDLTALLRLPPLVTITVRQREVWRIRTFENFFWVFVAHFTSEAKLAAANCVLISNSFPRVTIFRLSRAPWASVRFAGGI